MRVLVHHASSAELRQRVADVRGHLANESETEVLGTQSRNHLLTTIAERRSEGHPDVVLVDLRVETGDIEQSGLRIVETIRRHELLGTKSRPLVWTEHATAANVAVARVHGAYGVISDAWVDDATAGKLGDAIHWAASLRASSIGSLAEFAAWPPHPRPEEADRAERDASFARWFGIEPQELDYYLLWGLANAVEMKFLRQYLVDLEVIENHRKARRRLEELQKAMKPQVEALDRAEPGRAEIARRFLAESVPAQPDPLDELTWPRSSHIDAIWFDRPDVVNLAFLDKAALELMPSFLRAADPERTGVDLQFSAIKRAVEAAAREHRYTFAEAHSILHRASHNLDDAWRDDCEFGTEDKHRPKDFSG